MTTKTRSTKKHNATTFRPITDRQVIAKLARKGDKTAVELKTSSNHMRYMEQKGLVVRTGSRSVPNRPGRPAITWRVA